MVVMYDVICVAIGMYAVSLHCMYCIVHKLIINQKGFVVGIVCVFVIFQRSGEEPAIECATLLVGITIHPYYWFAILLTTAPPTFIISTSL